MSLIANESVLIEKMTVDALDCAESGDPGKAVAFKKQYGLYVEQFDALHSAGNTELLEKVNGAQYRLREALQHESDCLNAVVYEHGNDTTSWNAQVVERGGVYRVDVFDADGDMRHGKGGYQRSLLEAIQHADYAVLPLDEQEPYGPADRFPGWSQGNALSALNEGWCIADSTLENNNGGRWKVMGTGTVSDLAAWAAVLTGTDPHHAAARAFLEAHNPAEMRVLRATKVARTIHVVAFENNSAGMMNWYETREAADERVTELQTLGYVVPGDEINLFAYDVPRDLSNEEISILADRAMWERAYVPLIRIAVEGGEKSPQASLSEQPEQSPQAFKAQDDSSAPGI